MFCSVFVLTCALVTMHLLIVLPRRSPADRSAPNSVDLCVRDLVAASRRGHEVCIVTDGAVGLFNPFPTERIHPSVAAHSILMTRHVAGLARARKADLVVVHQQFQVAARLARLLPGRVVFHAHGFYKKYPPGLLGSIRRRIRRRELARLAGLVHVSEACRAHFAESWPDVALPQAVVHNGLDFTLWRPHHERLREVICVGRCVPEKGILEAAEAVERVLAERPKWRARFVLSEPGRKPEYERRVREVLSQPAIADRVAIEFSLPWERVRERYEQAAIALVPSRWREPFGRTALEAHAGGAALISSGTGGLREVSGPFALFADPEDTTGFAAALQRLIDDESLRQQLAQGGARYVRKRFSIAAVASTNDDFLDSLNAKLTWGRC